MSRKRKTLNEKQLIEVQVAYDRSRDGLTKTRLLGVRLYGQGEACATVLAIVRCSRSSLMNWMRTYEQSGVSGLCDQRQGGNSAKLTVAQVAALQKQLHQSAPKQCFSATDYAGEGDYWRVPTLTKLVKRQYGVVYQSSTSYRTLLKRCQLSLQKPAIEYKSHSLLRVMEFEEQLEKN